MVFGLPLRQQKFYPPPADTGANPPISQDNSNLSEQQDLSDTVTPSDPGFKEQRLDDTPKDDEADSSSTTASSSSEPKT
jgi:hypothetical protein